MADFYNKLSSLIFGRSSKATDRPVLNEQPNPEPNLHNLNDLQIAEFISGLSERAVIRLIQTTKDKDLQIRILNGITHEAVLRRISRSEIDKKLKRLADKKLRASLNTSAELRNQKLESITRRIQDFLKSPNWMIAQGLLDEANDPIFEGEIPHSESTDGIFLDFENVKKRLIAEFREYERTCAEMDQICSQLDPANSLSRAKIEALKNRWVDLVEKYPFPADFPVIQQFNLNLTQRATGRKIPKTVEKPQAPNPVDSELAVQKEKQKRALERAEADRKVRLEAMEGIIYNLKDAGEHLNHLKVDNRLRSLQKQLSELKNWRSEFTDKFKEAETLLKDLLIKRNELVNEAKWSAWARTDKAIRIQADLEKKIASIEAEADPELALKNAMGLGQLVFDYANEMRELGSLERDKDHKIWEQFKFLSDQAWVLCDKTRHIALEKLKSTLSEHLVKPIEFTPEVLLNPRTQVQFKITAFESAVSSRVKELQAIWSQIGSKRSKDNQENETVFLKLFECYFRQLNLHLGQLKRIENSAIQKKQELVQRFSNLCEGKSPLTERVRQIKFLTEAWNKEPIPEAAPAELQIKYEDCQSRIKAQIAEALNQQLSIAVDVRAQVQAILEQIQASNGSNLSQALHSISNFETQLTSTERSYNQIEALDPCQSVVELGTRFREILKEIKDQILAVREAVKTETAARASARNNLIMEAESLALSTNWERSQARFEELKQLWKISGTTGQSEDSLFAFLFEHLWKFYFSRSESRTKEFSSSEKTKVLRTRKELLLALEALTRFTAPKTESVTTAAHLRLPFSEEERAKTAGKVLELGLKYKQILSLDPKNGLLKETKKIMTEWSQLGISDDALSEFWPYYLSRIHELLGISI